MNYGYFDDQHREFVITTPKTPFPWINYLGCEQFFALSSHTAGGYAFFRDARLRRITRFRYNNVPVDAGGRCFYLRDGDDGTLWSPAWLPVKSDLDSFECRHGLGYTTIRASKNDIASELLLLVPLGHNCEIQRLRLRNGSNRPRNLTVFSMIEFCLWNAMDDMTNFQRNWSTGEVEVEDRAIYHCTEYRERRNHYAFYSVNLPVAGFDTDRETFLGPYGSFQDPEVPRLGISRNSIAHGWAPIASHAVELQLAPGESKDLIFLLGYVENPPAEKWESPGVIEKSRARALQQKFSSSQAVDDALHELRNHWQSLLERFQLHHGDEKLCRMVNIWNPYQVMVTFNMSRSASYFESGIGRGMGFRDSNQDLLGFVHMIPERARERILDLAATQFEDGGAFHQYQPLTKRGNHELGGGFNDDPLWLIASTSAYLRETGDWTILDETVPFENDPNRCASLLEHLKRSFHHVLDHRGPHGLPLIGRADWNDCLNLNCFSETPDESFQTCENRQGDVAESVLIAGMFCFYGPDYVEICQRCGWDDEAELARREIETMRQAILEHGWDGEWFLRAYDAEGNRIGSRECAEGKIFIESQGFCAMARVGAEKGYPEQALAAVAEHLETPHGIVLLQPAYSRYDLRLGEISSYPPGYKENAGIFCHNNPWVIIAEALAGHGQRAFELYRKISPAWIEDQRLHRTEPYVYSQMIAGKDAPTHGEAKNSWLTGTAAWMLVSITQYILGIKPGFDGLVVDPCIPAEWSEYRVRRFYRGAWYDITIRNPQHVCHGVQRILLDGEEYASTTLPVFESGEHQVIVDLGN